MQRTLQSCCAHFWQSPRLGAVLCILYPACTTRLPARLSCKPHATSFTALQWHVKMRGWGDLAVCERSMQTASLQAEADGTDTWICCQAELDFHRAAEHQKAGTSDDMNRSATCNLPHAVRCRRAYSSAMVLLKAMPKSPATQITLTGATELSARSTRRHSTFGVSL